MVRKSYGPRRGTRRKLRAKTPFRIRDYLRTYEIGDRVNVVLNSRERMVHPRFYGKTGTVVEKRGRAYVVNIRDSKMMKTIVLKPEHLTKANA
ncbi:MAG: 50S ribosomal protein L21e [Candidatus Aenigmarchaeota archaeon]|nr:50S ribosomal protein L21e [Candidatus Aenigmarchaeota archaeon]